MKIQSTLLFFLLLVFASCQTSEVISDFDSKTDFSTYKTFSVCLDDFQISSEKHPEYNNEKMKMHFKEAIESEMKKYYTQNDTLFELRAGVKIVIEDKKISYRSCDRPEDYHEWPECTFKTYDYTEGTLIIYVADVAKNQIVWQATVSGITSENLIENKKIIVRTVEGLFKDFPLNKGEDKAL